MQALRIKGVMQVLLASALWGMSGPLTKILRSNGLNILDILSWRYVIAFLSLGGVTLVSSSRRKIIFSTRPILKSAGILAFSLLCVNTFFLLSNFYTTVAKAITLNFTAPLFAAVLSRVFLKEKITLNQLLAIFIGLCGVNTVVFGNIFGTPEPPSRFSPDIPLGNVLALLSGAFLGGYLVVVRKIKLKDTGALFLTLGQFFFLALLMVPWVLYTLQRGFSAENIFYLMIFGIFCTALPVLLVNRSGAHLTAHEIAILLLTEIPFSIIIGMMLLGEVPSAASWAGVILICWAAYLVITGAPANPKNSIS